MPAAVQGGSMRTVACQPEHWAGAGATARRARGGRAARLACEDGRRPRLAAPARRAGAVVIQWTQRVAALQILAQLNAQPRNLEAAALPTLLARNTARHGRRRLF